MRAFLAAVSSLAFAGCAQLGGAPSPEARSQLAPTGVLRVAVLTSNPIIGTRDGAQHVSQLKGTTVDLGNDLARRAGVPARMIEYTAIPK